MARTPKVVDDRREQIMEAALRVFAQKGFANATNKDIARAAGITPGLIYHYFKSKEDLLRAVVDGRSPVRVVRSLPPDVLDLPPEALFRLLGQQLMDVVEDEHFIGLVRVFLPEAIQNPGRVSLNLAAMQEVVAYFEKAFTTKMDSGELRRTDAKLAVELFIGSIMNLMLRRQIMRDPQALQYSRALLVDGAVSNMLLGLLPR